LSGEATRACTINSAPEWPTFRRISPPRADPIRLPALAGLAEPRANHLREFARTRFQLHATAREPRRPDAVRPSDRMPSSHRPRSWRPPQGRPPAREGHACSTASCSTCRPRAAPFLRCSRAPARRHHGGGGARLAPTSRLRLEEVRRPLTSQEANRLRRSHPGDRLYSRRRSATFGRARRQRGPSLTCARRSNRPKNAKASFPPRALLLRADAGPP